MMIFYPRKPCRKVSHFCVLAVLMILFFDFVRDCIPYSQTEFNYVAKPLRPERYPVSSTFNLPRRRPVHIPKIQHALVAETAEVKEVRETRLAEVRDTFLHAWNGYKQEAWLQDEMRPISGGFKSPFCGWAATLVDSLDTLIIMGLHEELDLALDQLGKIDFTHTEGCQINLFETTIRHLGGLLSAFDLSGGGHFVLILKAIELAEVLFTAFDTPNRMPSPHYVWSATDPDATNHIPSRSVVLAVLGSLSLEFTRLSQITGNDKYFDGIQRVMNELEKWQTKTSLPGMWPAIVDATKFNESIAIGSPIEGADETFTLGALADSAYEYLPKQYLMLGGHSQQYRSMYESFVEVAKKYLFFRPMNIGEKDILVSGSVTLRPGGHPRLTPNMEHLTCFTGGMLAIAGKIFDRPEDVADGRRLTDGCIWAYQNTISGIMPETFTAVPCVNKTSCPWDEALWYHAIDPIADTQTIRQKINNERLSPGFAMAHDRRYLLRPEAIESVFVLWRITADQHFPDSGWDMFTAIRAHTTTALAHSAIDNVLLPAPAKTDEMESFWLAETLKYFYLLYSEPSVVSLDRYVLNTEAHPMKRPR